MKPERTIRRVGLARALSKLGYCSRSQAAELISAGRVSLNGKVHSNPETPVSLRHDRVAMDGQAIKARKKIYLIMNKPRGVVTTASDEKGRDTVYEVLRHAAASGETPGSSSWVAPVGRLDKASEGLLLLTNDSEWGACVTDPKTDLEKTYHVQIDKVVDETVLNSLVRGVTDGEVLRAKRTRLLRSGQKNCWLEIVLDEGKNRQIRRMLAAINVEVLRLVRVSIGPLQLGDLAKGAVRPLTADEKRMLDHTMEARGA